VFNTRRAMTDPGDDMIGKMLKARYAGERLLTLNEFVGMACLVWGAGLDTVTAQLSLAMLNLATDTSLRDRLVEDPGLIPSAIEELIRFDGIVNQCRVATQDVELSGVLIRKGDRVNVMTGASGRDPQQFADPESLDFTRPANRHFGFGAGAHRCVGSHLARLELRVALEEIHRRMPTYRIDPAQPPMRHFGLVRGVDRLHLVVG
jgi:cytochrome P450